MRMWAANGQPGANAGPQPCGPQRPGFRRGNLFHFRFIFANSAEIKKTTEERPSNLRAAVVGQHGGQAALYSVTPDLIDLVQVG